MSQAEPLSADDVREMVRRHEKRVMGYHASTLADEFVERVKDMIRSEATLHGSMVVNVQVSPYSGSMPDVGVEGFDAVKRVAATQLPGFNTALTYDDRHPYGVRRSYISFTASV